MFPNWFDIALATLEAQQVMWLRYLRLVRGGAEAEAEYMRMISEKVAANGAAVAALMSGAPAKKVVAGYRRRVRANLRRLSREG